MMQGYFLQKRNHNVVFDMSFRRSSYGAFTLFSGLELVLDQLEKLTFTEENIAFLQSTNRFTDSFLDYLRTFRFNGDIWAMPEGSVCFPFEPVLRVHAPIAEALLIEGLILNIINYSSFISTKAARIRHAAGEKRFVELGLRRAPGPDGALLASRAAYIGGAYGTSNVEASKQFGIPYVGTMSHAWVMSFPNDQEAFKVYAEIYPDNSVFLLDTYNTLRSGLPSAIKVGTELKQAGRRFGVRLDSGDLDYLARAVRKELDAAGLEDAFIVATNNLDEHIISDLSRGNCPIDVWGIGTHLTNPGSQNSPSGVYKLSCQEEDNTQKPLLKISNNMEKTSLPGIKQVYRCFRKGKNSSAFLADIIDLDENTEPYLAGRTAYHPYSSNQKFQIPSETRHIPLLRCVYKQGERIIAHDLERIKKTVATNLDHLDDGYTRLLNPHVYKVSITKELKQLRDTLIENKTAHFKHEE